MDTVTPSQTCPLCLNEDTPEVALCQNLGDYVNADGERQGHGVCTSCLPRYLLNGRDNCLICRTPYGEVYQNVANSTEQTWGVMAELFTTICQYQITKQEVKDWHDFMQMYFETNSGGVGNFMRKMLETDIYPSRHRNSFEDFFKARQSALRRIRKPSQRQKLSQIWSRDRDAMQTITTGVLDKMATQLTKCCGYTVTPEVVRLWHDRRKGFLRWWHQDIPGVYLVALKDTPVQYRDVQNWFEYFFVLAWKFCRCDSSNIWYMSEKDGWGNDPQKIYEDEIKVWKEWWQSEQIFWDVEHHHDPRYTEGIRPQRLPVNVLPSETCPLCLDDDAPQVALCENPGDYVDANGVRQGHGVCTSCLPKYLQNGRDNCLVCRTPYSEKWLEAKNNQYDNEYRTKCQSIATKLTAINEQTVTLEEVKEYFDFKQAYLDIFEDNYYQWRRSTPQKNAIEACQVVDEILSYMLERGEIGDNVSNLFADGVFKAKEVWPKITEDEYMRRNEKITEMANDLTFLCQFPVTADEVRIWHDHTKKRLNHMARTNPEIFYSYMRSLSVFIFNKQISHWPYTFLSIQHCIHNDKIKHQLSRYWKIWWQKQREELFAGSFDSDDEDTKSQWGPFWHWLQRVA